MDDGLKASPENLIKAWQMYGFQTDLYVLRL